MYKNIGRVDTKKRRCQRCARIFWLSRYIEMEVSEMQKNILIQ